MDQGVNPEEQVIGACLLNSNALRFAAAHITPNDFADPRLGSVFGLVAAMVTTGEPVEPGTVSARIAERGIRGISALDLHHYVEGVGSAASAGFYAEKVREQSVRRALTNTGLQLAALSRDETQPPAQTLAGALAELKRIREDGTTTGFHAKTLEEVLEVEDDDDWVIEGLFKAGDRMIITGHEGLGKTTWIRQLAILMAAGVNPITLDPIEPMRCVVVDVENTEAQWRTEVRGMAANAARYGSVDPRRTLRLACTGRFDITSDKALGNLHRLVDEYEPGVLFIGPIYKLVPHGINNDDDAAPLITALDSLRDRGLVMVMEGHSPKGNGDERDLSPRGSAALMGWPEFGFGLRPHGTDAADVVRWRGDRDRRRQWPKRLWRGGMFPWIADEATGRAGRMERSAEPSETGF